LKGLERISSTSNLLPEKDRDQYKLKEFEAPSDKHMERLKGLIESWGIKAQIGG